MGIRIQPRDIDVPEDDPFRNDLLDRKESVEVLSHLVGSFDGPCALAIDAAWGNGKTTFLNIWAQHLRNQGFPVVQFNAWQTDFTEDPFVAISTELTDTLANYVDAPLHQKIADARNSAKKVLLRSVPGIVRIATSGILDISPLLEKEIGNALAAYVENRSSTYLKAKTSVEEFRGALESMASAVSETSQNHPIIVIIDELDRCRPSYAIELLEVAKHLFSVNHVVFVLAINRAQLEHSIAALYGSNFDASGYLRRFFDIDFRLPDPDRKTYISAALNSIRINDYFKRTKDQHGRRNAELVEDMLQFFFSVPNLSARTVAQAIHRLGLVFASLNSDQRTFPAGAIVALILRTINVDAYYNFSQGKISDQDIIDMVYAQLEIPRIRDEDESILFEALVIIAYQEVMSNVNSRDEYNSPLLEGYRKITRPDSQDENTLSPDQRHARAVLDRVQGIRDVTQARVSGIGFQHSVKRINLLSSGLASDYMVES